MLHSKQRMKLKTENSGGMFFPTSCTVTVIDELNDIFIEILKVAEFPKLALIVGILLSLLV